MARRELKITMAKQAFLISLTLSVSLGALSLARAEDSNGGQRVVYPKKSSIDFEGLRIEGEVRNPGEFYFQRKPEEKFDSLVKRRKNFHREMLRDVVMSR